MRIVIYGNSGSGKSTLAGSYAMNPGVQHLDLDAIAWEGADARKAIPDSMDELNTFIASHESWVIEGCYGALIREAAKSATELISMKRLVCVQARPLNVCSYRLRWKTSGLLSQSAQSGLIFTTKTSNPA